MASASAAVIVLMPRWSVAAAVVLSLLFGVTFAAPAYNAGEVERAINRNPSAVRNHSVRALGLARQAQDLAAELSALRRLIAVAALEGDTKDSTTHIERARFLARHLRDAVAECEVLGSEAELFSEQHREREAGASFVAAEACSRLHSPNFHLARVLVAKAQWLQRIGQEGDAIKLANQAHEIALRNNDRFAMALAINHMANALFRTSTFLPQESTGQAARYQEALRLIDPDQYRVFAAGVQFNLGALMLQSGHLDDAAGAFKAAAELNRQLGYKSFEFDVHVALAEVELERAAPRTALLEINQAEAAGQDLKNGLAPRQKFRLGLAKARALSMVARRHEALQTLHAQEAALQELNAPRHRARFLEAAVSVRTNLGDFEQAVRLARELRDADRADTITSNLTQITESRTKYDAEKKERENAELRSREQEQEIKYLRVTSILAVAVSFMGVSIFVVRMRYSRALRAASAIKVAIVDHSFESMVTADSNGEIVEANAAACLLFGYSREQLLGRLMISLLRPLDLSPERNPFQEAIESQQRTTLTYKSATGEDIFGETVVWATQVDGAAHTNACIRDVTELRRSAEVIDRQREELRQSEKLTTMGSLLAGVAHELNNPLAVVVGRASLLESVVRDPNIREQARQIHEAANRCGRIVKSFLNMARQRESVKSQVQLNDLVRASTEMLSYMAKSRSISVKLQLLTNMPAFRADGDQLGQIILNLMINAHQALQTSSPPRVLTVETGMETQGTSAQPCVFVLVADNGPGISAALKERIFDPFFTTKKEGLGTGLGLSFCRSIARSHGGDVNLIASEVGASFKLWLPFDHQELPAPHTHAIPAGRPDDANISVLIVDDEPDLAEVILAMLSAAQIQGTVATSGHEALDHLKHTRFGAAIIDVHMPSMSGIELWQEIRRVDPALAKNTIFTTGDTLSRDTTGVHHIVGSQLVLEKPFSDDELISNLRSLFR